LTHCSLGRRSEANAILLPASTRKEQPRSFSHPTWETAKHVFLVLLWWQLRMRRISSRLRNQESWGRNGAVLRHSKEIAFGTSLLYINLGHPAVFNAVDVIDREPSDGKNSGAIRFYYAVVEVAGLPEDYRAVPSAADDADEVQWVNVQAIKTTNDLIVNVVAVLEEALARFAKRIKKVEGSLVFLVLYINL